MGYWKQNEQGVSFADAKNHGELIWGDWPADIMGAALKEIIAAFEQDRNRLPTEAEIKAGLLFSLKTALETAEKVAVK